MICLDSSYRLRDIWSLRIVNITTSQELPSFTVDSPDSSSIRMITFLIGKLSGSLVFFKYLVIEEEDLILMNSMI